MVSLPAPPLIVLVPVPPSKVSSSPPPVRLSFPEPVVTLTRSKFLIVEPWPTKVEVAPAAVLSVKVMLAVLSANEARPKLFVLSVGPGETS